MKPQLSNLLRGGKIVVIPTDTIYGIVGSALNPDTVERIYHLRKRATDKPFIILISSLNDLFCRRQVIHHFNIKLIGKQKKFLQKVWPNPVSVVLPVVGEKWRYLHRGTKSLAFRIPKVQWLLDLLKQTGPLVAPSANYEGEKPSESVEEARKYFGERVSLYMDNGKIKSKPSTLIILNSDGSYEILRQGDFKL